MTPIEILRGAKVELARRGLHKGDLFANDGKVIPEGPCCLRGACIAAYGKFPVGEGEGGVIDRVWRLTNAAVADSSLVAADVSYNDLPTTTIDDVQALLDRAIALAEKEGT